MLAMKRELENIPLSDTQRDMLLTMENVLEQAWVFRNTPVPDRCMNPENISEVVYYFLQDKGAEYRAGLLYDRAKAEFDARMEEIAALPPKEILDHAYEKVIKEEFLGELEQGLDEWETDTLLTCPQPLAALYTEWMDNDFSFWDSIRGTVEKTVTKQAADLRRGLLHLGKDVVRLPDPDAVRRSVIGNAFAEKVPLQMAQSGNVLPAQRLHPHGLSRLLRQAA